MWCFYCAPEPHQIFWNYDGTQTFASSTVTQQVAAGIQWVKVPQSFLEALEGCFSDVFKANLHLCNSALSFCSYSSSHLCRLPPRRPLAIASPPCCLLPLSESPQVLPTLPFPGSLGSWQGRRACNPALATFVSLALKQFCLNTESYSLSNISISN